MVMGGGGRVVCNGGGGGGRAWRQVAGWWWGGVREGGGGRFDEFQIAAGKEGGREQDRATETEGSRTRAVRARRSIRRQMRKREYG